MSAPTLDRLLIEALHETYVLSRVWDTQQLAPLQALLEQARREVNRD